MRLDGEGFGGRVAVGGDGEARQRRIWGGGAMVRVGVMVRRNAVLRLTMNTRCGLGAFEGDEGGLCFAKQSTLIAQSLMLTWSIILESGLTDAN